jgi:hypothetical protein
MRDWNWKKWKDVLRTINDEREFEQDFCWLKKTWERVYNNYIYASFYNSKWKCALLNFKRWKAFVTKKCSKDKNLFVMPVLEFANYLAGRTDKDHIYRRWSEYPGSFVPSDNNNCLSIKSWNRKEWRKILVDIDKK